MARIAIGFTGTQQGMTQRQLETLAIYFVRYRPLEFHHGDCIGADVEAHVMLRRMVRDCVIHAWPSNITDKRAFCDADVIHEVMPPLERNRMIVGAVRLLLAAPAQIVEERRSGTWATVRYARKAEVPVIIINPHRRQG